MGGLTETAGGEREAPRLSRLSLGFSLFLEETEGGRLREKPEEWERDQQKGERKETRKCNRKMGNEDRVKREEGKGKGGGRKRNRGRTGMRPHAPLSGGPVSALSILTLTMWNKEETEAQLESTRGQM